MLAAERRNLILEQLRRDERVLVGKLAQEFDVSEETIRRDLSNLEELGMANKCYGGATLADSRIAPPFRVRKKLNVEEKKNVASMVARLVEDGDFLMLDDSSTCYFIVRALHGKKGLTIVTNSIEIILEMSGAHEDWNIYSTGGNLDQDVFAFFGRKAEETIRSFHVDKAIISCTGMDMDGRFTEAGVNNANIKQSMMISAKETILAMDSHKFSKTAFITVGDFSLYSGALLAISNGVESIISTSAGIYEGTLFIDNLIVFMQEEAHIVPSLNPPRKVNKGAGHEITFENVSFAYPKTDKYVLKNLNFTISSGETIALIGLNGAGKTTLIKLLTRLYDPS